MKPEEFESIVAEWWERPWVRTVVYCLLFSFLGRIVFIFWLFS